MKAPSALPAILVCLALGGCADENTGNGLFSSGGPGGGPGGDGDGDGDGSGGGDADATAGDDTTGTGGADEGDKFDVGNGGGSAGDEGGGECGCGNNDWSYVWIANSGESTVSKIDTRTLKEEGRYRTRPDSNGNPSRTSVSIDGKAVAVANRHTGIVKIWSRTDDCDPNKNGQPGLQTSTGKNNVLAWGDDDCVEWYVPFAGKTVQRPVQWTPGEGDCHENQKIWTTTGAMGTGPGMCGKSGVWVHRLNGSTGAIEDEIHIPDAEFPCDHTGTDLGLGLGPYGGAVDYEGNFWFHGWGTSKLARIDFETLDYEIFSGGGYGITVDTEGRVWLSSSISRFDYKTKEKKYANVSTSGGIAQDLQGRIWAAGQNGVVWVDMETLAIGDNIALPGNSGQVKGVSVDIDGYIWAVRQGDTRAYKIDPDTYALEFYDGLNQPYTYSDMTGGQINNVTCNPPEG
jgi:hypothetical protein